MVTFTAPIDPHVHFRGDEYPPHPFMQWGFEDAEKVGLLAIIEQPNPKPFLTNEEAIEDRIEKVKEIESPVSHGIHIGLTDNPQQVKSALVSVMQGRHGLVSDKTFYVHSTGNMGILNEVNQAQLWKIKGNLKYDGVSIGHFEDEEAFIGEFNPEDPLTHSIRQSPEAETVQVKRQLENAVRNEFRGTFYIAHTSSKDTVHFVSRKVEEGLPFPVVMEFTFHHLFLNTDDYKVHGNGVKMNPPLRTPLIQQFLQDYVVAGNYEDLPGLDVVIGTDHAPHPIERKRSLDNPPSGLPELPFWPKGIELLLDAGIRRETLDNITFHNTNRIFKRNLKPRNVNVEYDPSLWEKYGYNPFSRVDGSS